MLWSLAVKPLSKMLGLTLNLHGARVGLIPCPNPVWPGAEPQTLLSRARRSHNAKDG